MTTFKPGDVVERIDGADVGWMKLGSVHAVAMVSSEDGELVVEGDDRSWSALNFRLVSRRGGVGGSVGKLRLFPASTALARGR